MLIIYSIFNYIGKDSNVKLVELNLIFKFEK